jgi:hypothetical protein
MIIMKSEDDPITDDEGLLRRVRREQFRTAKVPTISPNAFEPRIKGRAPDDDGISFYRQACLDNPVDILQNIPPDRRGEYGIVRISVSFLRSLNLSVRSKPEGEIKGHVVVPELNASDYKINKARYTPIKEQLAREASKREHIALS